MGPLQKRNKQTEAKKTSTRADWLTGDLLEMQCINTSVTDQQLGCDKLTLKMLPEGKKRPYFCWLSHWKLFQCSACQNTQQKYFQELNALNLTTELPFSYQTAVFLKAYKPRQHFPSILLVSRSYHLSTSMRTSAFNNAIHQQLKSVTV